MVQVLRSNQRSFLDSLLGGAAGGAEAASKIYPDLQKRQMEEQKVQDYNRALQNVQQIYNNPELSDQQKLIGAYKELAQNPTLAPHLGAQLSRVQAHEESFKDRLLKNQQLQEAGSKYAQGYDAIVNNDTEELNKILHDPETSFPVKKQLTDLRDKYETRKGVQARELRSRQTLVQKSYKQAIDAQRKLLERARPKEKPAIEKEIKRLDALQKHDLKKLTKNPDFYSSLALWNNVEPDFLPVDGEEGDVLEDEFGDFGYQNQDEAKVKFDPNNPEHKAKAQQLYKKLGNKEEVRKILALEFGGL